MARVFHLQKSGGSSVTQARVGEKLLQMNLITRDQLQIALHEQRRSGRMLGLVLVQLGFLNEEMLATVLAERAGLDRIDLKTAVIDPALLQKLPRAVAQRCRAVPVHMDGNRLEIAMADPYDVAAMDEIRRHFPRPCELLPMVASAADIADVIDRYGSLSASLDTILKELETGEEEDAGGDVYQHPVVRLVNTILFDAVRRGASDIHLEPENSFVRLRLRIDGVLQQTRALHRSHWPELSHRIKIMAGLNIADTRSLQNGRFQLHAGSAEVDFRVAVMPTVQGENIVIRILDHRQSLLPLEDLGFDAQSIALLDRIMARPEGIVIVTGPTGCGKTTTLYSFLRRISHIGVNVMTLEEPVEYQLGLIRQTAIQEQQGLTFGEGVRGILRQDPDIIFIGEVRDADTAQMALRAAMTGHQVFSTLHCNDALGAIPRLIDLGLHPRMLSGNITAIVAQRLVRKLCPYCRQERPAVEAECATLGCRPADVPMIFQPGGCEYCNHTGYRGRIAIAEILPVTPELDDLIAQDASRSVMRKLVRAQGLRPMQQDGIAKVMLGLTSLDELARNVDMRAA